MNAFLNGLKTSTNFTHTENGSVTHRSTLNPLLDMFAMGGAYRSRSDNDCILLFKNALEVDELHALKCLFYLRDITEGQGERRFFRVCLKWLANTHPEMVKRNIQQIAFYGRWDDLYCLVGTPVEKLAFNTMKDQLALDLTCKTPSLLAKWLKSENTSSAESRKLANKTREYFHMNHKQYRKTLSYLRERINVLERLMSANEWDKIEFDKIPSKAGIKYKNAFARRDIIKAKYEKFAKDATTKVNAKVLYPADVVHECKLGTYFGRYHEPSEAEIAMIDKYWENLRDFYNGREERGLAIVDTSGSMYGQPIEAALGLGAYVAQYGKGPFKDHFITFSARPTLVKFEGVNFYDKMQRALRANWNMNTNLEKVFDLLLDNARVNHLSQDEMPTTLYIFSDMQFDSGCIEGIRSEGQMKTLIERIAVKWSRYGYTLPRIIFWNLDTRTNTIPAIGPGFSYVSGYSPSMVDCILSGKDGLDLCLEKLDSARYAAIH